MKRRLNSILLVPFLLTLTTACQDQQFYEKAIYETFNDQVENPIDEIDKDLSPNEEQLEDYVVDQNENQGTSQINDHVNSESESESESADAIEYGNGNGNGNGNISNHNDDNNSNNENCENAENQSNEDAQDEVENQQNQDSQYVSENQDENQDENQENNNNASGNESQENTIGQTTDELDGLNEEALNDDTVYESVSDYYIQSNELNSKVDILWVIDNSGSMEDEQAALAFNFDIFIKDFITKDIDFKMAITTTDTSRDNAGQAVRGSINALTKEQLDKDSNEFIKDFARMIQVGTSGSGNEKGLEAAEAFTERYKSNFFRADAYFVTVFVSDEDDQSEKIPAEYVTKIQEKLNDSSKIKFYSIVSHSEEEVSRWITPGHQRYREATELTGGKIANIDNNFYSTLQELGQSIAKLTESFSLKQVPVENSIKVYVNNNPILDGWNYDSETRTVFFEQGHIPVAGSNIQIEYLITK